jgi:hypothetical protein
MSHLIRYPFFKKIDWQKIPYLSCGCLIFSNLIPFYGVLFLHWSIFSIVILYLLESVVFGFFLMLKVSLVDKPHPDTFGFIFFYWMCLVVYWFVTILLFRSPEISLVQVGSVLFLILLSHSVSFSFNFIIKEEFKLVSAEQLLIGALERVIIIQTISVATALTIDFVNNPALPIVSVMIIAKTIIDLFEHLKEHA